MRLAIVFALAIAASGCITYRDKVAYKRAEVVLADRGTKGDELAAACGAEVAQANLDTGASQVALGEADLTPEAAAANSTAIQAARETRQVVWETVKSIAGKAASSWPPLAGIIGGLGLVGGLLAKLLKYKKSLETVVEGVGAIANKDTKAKIRALAADYGVLPFLDKVVQSVDPSKDT